MRAVLGIDVGGTKTHALIASDNGEVLGFGQGVGSNWESVGLEAAYETWAQVMQDALSEAGLSAAQLIGGGYGLAGLDWPSDHDRLRPLVDHLGVGGLQVLVNDAFEALWAGTRDGCGVVVIAGTGTTVAGRNRQGEEARTLGFSAHFGDWGGAGDIVRAAIYAIATAHTGRGVPTALSQRFVEVTRSRDAADFLEGLTRGRFRLDASAAPHVFEVAQAGDEVAQGIFRRAGRELGGNATVIIRRLDMESEAFDLVLSGGVLRSGNRLLLETLEGAVRQAAPLAHPILLTAPPVIGAALLAFDAVGAPLPDEAYQNLLDGMAEKASATI